MSAEPLPVRELTTIAELQDCESLERAVWGIADLEVTPAAMMMAGIHAGGLVAGAYDDTGLAGFAFAIPAYVHGEHGLHSHLAAVRPGLRDRGLGTVLKRFQRRWALRQGIASIRWTCDPLQSRNVYLNIVHLGALGVAYHPDLYGRIGGDLNADLPTDRLVIDWRLDSDRARAAAGEADAGALRAPAPATWAVSAAPAGEPAVADAPEDAPLGVATPPDLDALLGSDPALALRWRLAVREALLPRLRAGWRVTGAGRGYVLIEPPR